MPQLRRRGYQPLRRRFPLEDTSNSLILSAVLVSKFAFQLDIYEVANFETTALGNGTRLKSPRFPAVERDTQT